MGVRLGPELVFAEVAATLESEYTFNYDKVILKSVGSEKVCTHWRGWFNKTKTEYKLKRILGRFDWVTENKFSFFIFGKDYLEWGKKFAENLSSALGADVILHLDDKKDYEYCPDPDHQYFYL